MSYYSLMISENNDRELFTFRNALFLFFFTPICYNFKFILSRHLGKSVAYVLRGRTTSVKRQTFFRRLLEDAKQ